MTAVERLDGRVLLGPQFYSMVTDAYMLLYAERVAVGWIAGQITCPSL
jgi:hypothetical protein